MLDKERFHVLEKNRELIEKVERSEEMAGNLGQPKFRSSNFIESTYIDSWDRKQTEYLLTKNGCTMLVIRYDDDNAIDFQLAYIRRYNEIEKYSKCQGDGGFTTSDNLGILSPR